MPVFIKKLTMKIIRNDHELRAAVREKELIALEFQKSIKNRIDVDIRALPLNVVIETIDSLKKVHKTYPRLQELEQACMRYKPSYDF